MGRVIRVLIWDVDDSRRPALIKRFDELAESRQWRDETPRLATTDSNDFFSMEYFRLTKLEATLQPSIEGHLAAATFVRLRGDAMDALALAFILRDVSESFAAHINLTDVENPIAKLRNIELVKGRLPDGRSLEEILVRRPVF